LEYPIDHPLWLPDVLAKDRLAMINPLTDEQETLLVDMVEKARDRARQVWRANRTFDLTSPDEAFNRGFEAAMDFALGDEFMLLISQIKSIFDVSGPIGSNGG
jgi:hypothetical protein